MKQTEWKAVKRGVLFDLVYLAGILGPKGGGQHVHSKENPEVG